MNSFWEVLWQFIVKASWRLPKETGNLCFLSFLFVTFVKHTFDIQSARDMFGKDMVWEMFWEFLAKVIFLLFAVHFPIEK